MTYPAYKVAAVHTAPVFLEVESTVHKACDLIAEAARHGARLIVFPETFVPGFPIWCSLRAPIRNHELFRRLAAGAIRCPGPEIARLCQAAREHAMVVSLGFNEGTDTSVGCIWNSNVIIGDSGEILAHHRKIVPTFYEKLVWAAGDGAGLRVCETALGRLGMLICGENTNSLARFTLLAQGEQVHMASYPPIWPSHTPEEAGNYDLRQGIMIRAGAHAFEGKVFNIVASGYLDQATFDLLASLDVTAAGVLESSPRGVSVVIGPTGMPLSPVQQDEEGLLYADIDLSAAVELKQIHDVVGGYNRFDIFKLTVDRSRREPISFGCEADGGAEPG